MANYLIYKYTSPSGKSYIGQTNNIKRRENKHKTENGCRAFAAAIAKYGFDNFTREILLENLSLDDANIKEEYYIRIFNTLSPNGYNLTTGGDNKVRSEEYKQALSKALTGKKHTPESIAKMKLAKGGENHPRYGKFGKDSPISKTCKITFPDGHVEIVVGLNAFCKEHNLDQGHMGKCASGKYKQHKGFMCEYIPSNQHRS